MFRNRLFDWEDEIAIEIESESMNERLRISVMIEARIQNVQLLQTS